MRKEFETFLKWRWNSVERKPKKKVSIWLWARPANDKAGVNQKGITKTNTSNAKTLYLCGVFYLHINVYIRPAFQIYIVNKESESRWKMVLDCALRCGSGLIRFDYFLDFVLLSKNVYWEMVTFYYYEIWSWWYVTLAFGFLFTNRFELELRMQNKRINSPFSFFVFTFFIGETWSFVF